MTSEQYLAAVDARLADLPWRLRKNLVSDLRVHLGEIPPEQDLVTRLGSPGSYAAELRAAADLKASRGPIAFLRARRPRNVVITLALLAVAAALAAAVAWARSYQPLLKGSSGLSPVASRQGALGETVAVFRDGRPFQFGVSVRNNGRFPVRILQIAPLLRSSQWPFVVRPFLSSTRIVGKPASAFHPFTLEPGHEREIIFRGTYANCDKYSVNSGVTLVSWPVRYRFLFWTHTVQVPLQDPIVINMPKRNPCVGH